MHWRHALVWTGSGALASGIVLTIVSVAREWRGTGSSAGLALGLAGLILMVFGHTLRTSGTISDIYNTGYQDGLAQGRREGIRVARPVVVPLDRERRLSS